MMCKTAIGSLGFVFCMMTVRGQDCQDKPAPPKDADAETRRLWFNAGGGGYEGVRRDAFGELNTRSTVRVAAGEMPGFMFGGSPRGKLSDLPEPAGPFAINMVAVFEPPLAELAALKNLHTLRLNMCSFSPKVQKGLADLKQLRSLSIHMQIKDSALEAISGLAELEAVQIESPFITDAGLEVLSKLPKLHTLVLHGADIREKGWQTLASLKQLQTFNFKGGFAKSPISNKMLQSIATFPKLQAVALWDRAEKDIDWKHLAAVKELRALKLFSLPVKDQDLANLTELKKLETLYLYFSPSEEAQITDAGLKSLLAFPKLQSLTLHGKRMTDEGFKSVGRLNDLTFLQVTSDELGDAALSEIARLRKLRSLTVWSRKITDAGLKKLPALNQLEHLSLSYSGITNEGLRSIGRMKTLRTFHAHGTKVTPQGRLALKRAIPGIETD